jgi:hypothetical protein
MILPGKRSLINHSDKKPDFADMYYFATRVAECNMQKEAGELKPTRVNLNSPALQQRV